MVTSNAFFADINSDAEHSPRRQLQRLTLSDPVAAANMAQHVIAAGLLVTGVAVDRREDCKTKFSSGFILTLEERDALLAATSRLGITRVFLCFDVDDAAGALCAMSVFRNEGDQVAIYPRCALWAPANDGRAVIVPCGPGAPRCHFVARPNRPLARIEGLPIGDLEAGLRRGQARLQRLARSVELRDAHIDAIANMVRSASAVV